MKKISAIYMQEKLRGSNLRLFTVSDFQKIFKINYEAAKRNINRYVKSDILGKAKKGLYFLKINPPAEFEIANKLYRPSYVSFETSLSFYGIIPETIYEVISANPRISRNFLVNDLKFSYKKIKKSCFLGYHPEKIKNNVVLIADPEKALADYLYFVALKKRKLSYERINLKKIKKTKLIRYARCFKNKRLLKIIEAVYATKTRQNL